MRTCPGEVREDFLEEVVMKHLWRTGGVRVTWAEEQVGMESVKAQGEARGPEKPGATRTEKGHPSIKKPGLKGEKRPY